MSVPEVLLSSGYKIPSIGVGMFKTKDLNEVERTIQGALDAGYRHIDTAFSYFNEEYIGSCLQKLFLENKIKREDVFIVSKLPPNGLRPDAVPDFFHKSLSDLKLDYLDLYLVHFPVAAKRTDDDSVIFPMKNGVYEGDVVDLVETWRALEKLVKEGLVKSIGLSNCNSQQIQRVYDAAEIKPSILQVECHAYLPQFELQDFCKKLNIAITAYAPLGSPGTTGGDIRLIDEDKLKPMCQKYRKTPAQILLRYLVQRDIIVIPKSSNPKRLAENFQIFDFSLSDEEMLALKSLARNKRYFTFESYPGMTDQLEYPFKIPY